MDRQIIPERFLKNYIFAYILLLKQTIMYNVLQHAHSGLRWVVLIILIIAIVKSITAMSKPSTEVGIGNDKIFGMNLGFFHLQVILGIILFFISARTEIVEGFMKEAGTRFYVLEHPLMMVIAAILVTVGHVKAKKITESKKKNKTLFIYNLITLLIILTMIPWPFRTGLGGSWF